MIYPMSAAKSRDWLTPQEVASLKGVTRQSVTKAIREGRLPAERIGPLRYIIRDWAADEWQPAPQSHHGRRKPPG